MWRLRSLQLLPILRDEVFRLLRQRQSLHEYGRTLRTIKVKDVQVGMVLFVQGMAEIGTRTGWFTVTKSEMSDQTCTSRIGGGEPVTHQYWYLATAQGGCYTFPEADVQCVPVKARLAEIKTLALAYQSTLTVAGKPSKRKING